MIWDAITFWLDIWGSGLCSLHCFLGWAGCRGPGSPQSVLQFRHFSETNPQMQKLMEICASLMTFTLSESGKVITWKLPMKSHDSKELAASRLCLRQLWGSSRQMSASGGGNQDFGSVNVGVIASIQWLDDSGVCSDTEPVVTGACSSSFFCWGGYNWHVSKSLTIRRARLIGWNFTRTFSSEVYCVARTWLWKTVQ